MYRYADELKMKICIRTDLEGVAGIVDFWEDGISLSVVDKE